MDESEILEALVDAHPLAGCRFDTGYEGQSLVLTDSDGARYLVTVTRIPEGL